MNNKLNRDFATIEDFVWDDDFRQWVLNEDSSLADFWTEWLMAHPDKSDDLLTARDIVKSITAKETGVSDEEVEAAIQEIMLQIDHAPDTKPAHPRYMGWYKYTGIAAALLIVISIAWFFLAGYNDRYGVTYSDLVKESGNALVEKVNTDAQPKQIQLADGSKITLQKNARISFAPAFNSFNTRKVYLSGKALFEVAKNPEKPFLVYTSGLITKVLGTKFIITSNEGDKGATVEVISGIVSVFSLVDKKSQDETDTKKLNSLILTRNQKASFSRNERTLIASVVEHPVALNEKVFDNIFSDTPLKKIFKNIEDSYGIEVIYDEKALANRTLTADMSNTTMYEKLNIICKAVNARYEITDGKIVIYTNTAQ